MIVFFLLLLWDLSIKKLHEQKHDKDWWHFSFWTISHTGHVPCGHGASTLHGGMGGSMWIMDWGKALEFNGEEVGGQSGERLGLSISTGEGFPPSIFCLKETCWPFEVLVSSISNAGPAAWRCKKWTVACRWLFRGWSAPFVGWFCSWYPSARWFSYNVICSFSTLSKSLEFWKQHVSSNSPQLGYFSWQIYRLGCIGYRIMAVYPSSIHTRQLQFGVKPLKCYGCCWMISGLICASAYAILGAPYTEKSYLRRWHMSCTNLVQLYVGDAVSTRRSQ